MQEQSLLARVEDLEAARAEAKCLLQEKEQQLQDAWGEVEELREVIGRIEAELLELQREKEGLLSRQQGKERERGRGGGRDRGRECWAVGKVVGQGERGGEWSGERGR